jgi:hypothetical protein
MDPNKQKETPQYVVLISTLLAGDEIYSRGDVVGPDELGDQLDFVLKAGFVRRTEMEALAAS